MRRYWTFSPLIRDSGPVSDMNQGGGSILPPPLSPEDISQSIRVRAAEAVPESDETLTM